MGQINLFAYTLSPEMAEFLSTYKEGALAPVCGIRILDDDEFPRASITAAKLDSSYIVMEVNSPLAYSDVEWVYRALIGEEYVYDRASATRYSIERCLNEVGCKNPRRKVESEEEWVVIRHFRRRLEVLAIALRHLKATYREGGKLKVERHGPMMVIVYDALPGTGKPRRPRPA